jgi:hypothetical protein
MREKKELEKILSIKNCNELYRRTLQNISTTRHQNFSSLEGKD